MLKTYLKVAFRNLAKHRFYTGINIFGLALGISCCIILFQFISYHLSIDDYHDRPEQIYRIVDELRIPDGTISYEKGAPIAMANAVKLQVSQVKDAAVLLSDRSFTVAAQDNTGNPKLFAEHENIALTDKHWFAMFKYDWEEGNYMNALEEPNAVVITEKLARKYFNTTGVIGKTLIIDNHLQAKITGVLANIRSNTDFKTEIFISLASFQQLNPDFAKQMLSDWSFINSHTNVFFRLNDNASPRAVEKAIAGMVKKKLGNDEGMLNFKLLPLKEWHFDGRYAGVIQRNLLLILGFIGLLLIAIACVNFINMATAQSTKRAKEIGTRKVLGSTPASIFKQFIIETGIIALIAIALSTIVVIIFLPIVNGLLGTSFTAGMFITWQMFLFIIGLLTLVVLTAGFYPALILSRFRPIDALKNQLLSGARSTQITRKGLIIVQNVIAQVLIVCTVLMMLQTNFLKTADPGFNKDAVVMLPIPDHATAKTDYLRNLVLADPKIKDISYCYNAALSDSEKGGSVKYADRDWEKFTVQTVIGDADFAKTFGLKIIAGRNYTERDSANQFLINEKLVKMLGAKSPEEVIGRKFTSGDLNGSEGTIVGVVKDFHTQSLYKTIKPQAISANRDYYRFAAVKLSTTNLPAQLEHLRKAWSNVYTGYAFEYHFLDEQIASLYKKEELLTKLIQASTFVAIAISCLGLLGLVSLITAQRIKEIGVRKVLGASVTQIAVLLSGDFLKLVALSLVIALPLGWLLMHKWLQNFAYHINISVWVFAAAAALSIAIAILTTAMQAIRAASANPVDSLRNE